MSKLFKIALGITKGHSAAGMSYDDGADNSAEARAKRLVECGYVHLGDKNGWTRGALATLFLERKGGPGDCEPPYDYWEEYEATFSYQGPGHVEFVNAAVAGIYE
jgi:hypothetical protein